MTSAWGRGPAAVVIEIATEPLTVLDRGGKGERLPVIEPSSRVSGGNK